MILYSYTIFYTYINWTNKFNLNYNEKRRPFNFSSDPVNVWHK